MKIIKYRTFKCSEEMEKWQKDTEDLEVLTIIPIPTIMKKDINRDVSFTNTGVFVTYSIKEKVEEEVKV